MVTGPDEMAGALRIAAGFGGSASRLADQTKQSRAMTEWAAAARSGEDATSSHQGSQQKGLPRLRPPLS